MRRGPLAHMDARQRAKFHEEMGFSSPFLVLGGIDLAAGIVVAAGTPNLWQGIVGIVSGGLLILGGFSVMIHTLLQWSIGPPRKDYWSRRRGLDVAVLPGVLIGRW